MAGRQSTRIAAPESPKEPVAPPQTVAGQQLGPREAAEYIAQMLEGLRDLARREELSFVTYLLGLALEEVRRILNSEPDSGAPPTS
jgi:hypothetical protein